MANLKELRGRIASVKNTRKITSAMSRIAAARLAKAQSAVMASRPYGVRLREVVSHLVGGAGGEDEVGSHPLMEARAQERVLVISMNADRGLCGGFNANVNKAANAELEGAEDSGKQTVLICVGKKTQSFFKHQGRPMQTVHGAPSLETLVPLSKTIAAEAMAMFLPQEADTSLPRVDRVVLVYNKFVSVLTQQATPLQLLPIVRPEQPEGPEPSFEPGRQELLDHLLPVSVEAALQEAMFDSVASEVAARRMAMDSATDNATELIGDLTLEYNRERQAAITSELMEIIGGAEALKG